MEGPTQTLTNNFLGTLPPKGKIRNLKVPIWLYRAFSLKVKLTVLFQQPRQGGAVMRKDPGAVTHPAEVIVGMQ